MFSNIRCNILIHAPYTRIGVFWHIGNTPKWFRRFKFIIIPPCFVEQQYLWNIAIKLAVGCYNLWSNIPCLGCSPLGENRETGLFYISSIQITALYFQLSKMRYVNVTVFNGRKMVNIREYYDKDGDLRPGKKGKTVLINDQIMLQLRNSSVGLTCRDCNMIRAL